MKYLLTLLLPLFLFEGALGQRKKKTGPVPLQLPAQLTMWSNEYSSLAQWQSHILLIPQYPANFMFGISTEAISDAIKKNKAIEITNAIPFTFKNLNETIKKIDYYEGFEAAAVIKDEIYFTIETEEKNPFCYITKAKIEVIGNRNYITFDPNALLPLPKPQKPGPNGEKAFVKNAGFESITYSPDADSLVAFFEYNRDDADPRPAAWYIDKALTGYNRYNLQHEEFFRITDVTATGHHTILALNHFYPGKPNDRLEAQEYIDSDKKTASSEMEGKDPDSTPYTRILEFKKQENQLVRTNKWTVSFLNDNWEGMTLFNKGVLIIIDGSPGNNMTQMQYIPLWK